MYDLKLLGGALLVDEEGEPIAGAASRRHALALASILATSPTFNLSRPKVLGLLWPETDEGTGRNRLNSCLYHLRQALGSESVVSVGDDLRLAPDVVSCDVWRFERAFDRGAYLEAVRQYAGPFLDGFYLDASVPFETRTERVRSRLGRMYRTALERLAEEAEREGRVAEAAEWWRERMQRDPLDSRVASRLVQTLSAAGSRAEALRAGEAHARRLHAELGAAPDPAFRSLLERMRDVSSGARAGADGAGRGSEAVLDRAGPNESIAVLPFETLGEADAPSLGEGIHGGILTRLSKVTGLDVIARTSVRRYRSTRKTIAEIGHELAVDWVLEGEVQEAGGEFRIDVRLVEASSDRQVWAEAYTGTVSDESVFEFQAEITRRIVASLQVELSPDERARVERRPTRDLGAYRLQLQGQTLLEQRTADSMARAVECFEEVVERDPEYAVAWVGLADALGLLHAYGYVEADEVLPRAEKAIRRALQLDPHSAEAHASLGRLLGQRKQTLAADRELRRAVALRPSYAEAHNWLSVSGQILGRPEQALESAQRAVALNPLSPEASYNLGISYLINGQAERALEEARRSHAWVPEYATGEFIEGLILYEMGRCAEAVDALEGVAVPWAGSGPQTVVALSLIGQGDGDAAAELADEMQGGESAFEVGVLRAALGETDAAFAAFDRVGFGGVDHRESYWPTIAVRYLFREVWDRIQDDPRYGDLRRRLDRSWGLQAKSVERSSP